MPGIPRRQFAVALAALIAAGCQQGPSTTAQQAPSPLQQQQLAMLQRQQELQSRTSTLDLDNQDLQTKLAQSQQQSRLLQDQLAVTREQLNSTAQQLTQARETQQSTEQQAQALAASVKKRNTTDDQRQQQPRTKSADAEYSRCRNTARWRRGSRRTADRPFVQHRHRADCARMACRCWIPSRRNCNGHIPTRLSAWKATPIPTRRRRECGFPTISFRSPARGGVRLSHHARPNAAAATIHRRPWIEPSGRLECHAAGQSPQSPRRVGGLPRAVAEVSG